MACPPGLRTATCPGTCRYLSLEATASYVRTYAALAVPGLPQTTDYAQRPTGEPV